MYADIGHMSLQQHQRPSIPILDITTPIEYATINHHSVSKKKSVPAPLTAVEVTVNDQLNGIIEQDHNKVLFAMTHLLCILVL